MLALTMTSRVYFFGIALAIAGIALSACGHIKESGASTSYDKAYVHTGDAIQAAREKDFATAITFAETALKSEAQAAKKEFSEMNVEPDAQRDFDDGMKSLEGAIAAAGKGDQQRTEELLMQTRYYWRPLIGFTSDDIKSNLEPGKCHGEACIQSACGCANPNATGCNRFYPSRKCTKVGCNCYCQ